MSDKSNANFTPSQDPYKKLVPLNLCQLTNFPFIDETFDSITLYEMLQKLGCKLNEVIKFIDTTLEQELNEYINAKFNQMMLDTMYEEETETLIFYLKNNEESEV